MIGPERVQYEQRAARGEIGQRFGRAAPSLHRVSGRLAVQEREPAVVAHAEAGNRIVAAIGCKQKATIRREDDAARALEGVRRALLAADRLERPGAGAASSNTFHLGKRAVRISMIMQDRVFDLVRLHVEMSPCLFGIIVSFDIVISFDISISPVLSLSDYPVLAEAADR